MQILQGSDFLVLALSEESWVVGFVTAITDGVSSAYIPHLEVLPEWQGYRHRTDETHVGKAGDYPRNRPYLRRRRSGIL